MKKDKKLQIQHLDAKIRGIKRFPERPPKGWMRAIRISLGMTLRQAAGMTGVAAPNLFALEKSEINGAVTLKTLQKIAKGLNMKFVYGFLPAEGTFEKMIENRALLVARKIVSRTGTTMKLEDQQVEKARLDTAIKELAGEIKRELPKYLWD